ncbi:MAG: ribosome biogenesis factor YjgA [Gammaproteobacteria bacterium]|nr:ribosome biogenesis factor YjgA [Gammaproteobacteria bacterium]
MYEDDDNIEEREKSKSQVKREMHELLALGEVLVNLPKEQFAKIELPETLHDAVLEGRRITQHGAHKRQLQFIGKLMRTVDAEQIRQQVDTLEGHSKQAAANLHHIERWRDDLLTQGDAALERLLTEFPAADRQYLRQLIRNAKKEMQENRAPKSARSLFKYLRDLQDEA